MKKSLLIISSLALFLFVGKVQGQVAFYVQSPSSIAGSYDFETVSAATWGVDMLTVAVLDTLAVVDDGTADDSLGCNALVNGADIAGKIAVVYRGACEFGKKAFEAQSVGAVGVIVINNVPGAPIPMGAGAFGASVTIPAVMVSQSDGAIIRAAMNAGPVVAFMGNKTGFFANDLAMSIGDVVMAPAQALPATQIQTSADLTIPVGAWFFNRGSASQSGVRLKATVTLGGSLLYADSSAAQTVASGDSMFISLAAFTRPTWDTGYYELTYSVSSSVADDFADDNSVVTNFWINGAGKYSKARMNPATGFPTATSGGLRAGGGAAFEWCIALTENNFNGLTAMDLSFAAVTSSTDSLTGKAVSINFYEWLDDPDTVINNLILLTDPFQTLYEYTANLQGQYITVPLNGTTGFDLKDNTNYLACVFIDDPNTFLISDGILDYTTTINEGYGEAVSPVQTSGWFTGGFGPEDVPTIVVGTKPTPVGIPNIDITTGKPYPNPATESITIPFIVTKGGIVEVSVVDVTGRIVHVEKVDMTGTDKLVVNTNNLSDGSYFFTVKNAEINKTFKVIITK